MGKLFRRSDKRDLCDTNCVVLTLGEAVKRWTKDGQFMMTEVNGSDSYQSKDTNIDIGSYSARISKIEAALAGLDFVKDVKASADPAPADPAPADTAPAVSASAESAPAIS